MKRVAVLFARRDSIYKTIPGCDVWDEDRDARKWTGGAPIVAHPPCAQWGQLRQFSRPDEEVKALSPWAVNQVRTYGGVLEHPARSALWKDCGLPAPGRGDKSGWTLSAPQFWWGHPAEKASRFFIVGIEPADVPPIPFALGEPPMLICSSRKNRKAGHGRYVPHSQRDVTPPLLAEWLVELARRTSVRQIAAR